MNSSELIGGYFELELKPGDFPRAGSVLLNSGRSCFEYILQVHQATRVYLPKYTCDVLLEPLQRLHIPYTFYAIDENLELAQEVAPGEREFLVYNNYFGMKDDYCRRLSQMHGQRLILDCAQAFYFESDAKHAFYSPRKFFGVPDGGCLITDKRMSEDLPVATSYQRMSHLTKRIDLGARAGYADFRENESGLSGEGLKQMSPLTRRLLGTIDFAAARQKRQDNFAFLHDRLGGRNLLKLDSADSAACPMVYPYRSDDKELRRKLIEQGILVATYWPRIRNWCKPSDLEYRLVDEIIPLPIDQRYDTSDMQRMLDIIL